MRRRKRRKMRKRRRRTAKNVRGRDVGRMMRKMRGRAWSWRRRRRRSTQPKMLKQRGR